MEAFLSWALIGALIGFVAAQRKGLSPIAGVLGGAVLGPLAFLMFLVSGIASSSEARVKCPFCAEWVQRAAVVCPHCRRDLNVARPIPVETHAPPPAPAAPPAATPRRPAPPPGRGGALAAGLLMGGLLGAGGVGLLTAGRSTAAPPAETVRLDEDERASYKGTIAALRANLDAQVVRRVEAENATTDAAFGVGGAEDRRLAECQADLARYQSGLERAVDQLNRRTGGTIEIQPARPPRATPAPDYGRVHIYAPRVMVHTLGVLVEGRLYSSRRTMTLGTAVVRLLEDGEETAVERVKVEVAPNGSYEYSVIFHITPNQTGSYTAQVDLEEEG